MNKHDVVIHVVDDDQAVRKSLLMLMESVGLEARAYASAPEFLEKLDRSRPGCIVLDVRMPEMNGLELQRRLTAQNVHLPIIFLSAHGDIPMAVETMRAGAIDFLQKPFRDQDLLDRIQAALERDAEERARRANHDEIRDRLKSLTEREKQVMEKVVDGAPNKAVAADLGVSERTVEIHRSRVMQKMEAESLAHLVKMVLLVRQSR